MSPALPPVPWIRKKWKLKYNPFPAEAIATLGGTDDKENGRLFRPEVQGEQFDEAIGKFVLGAVYNGQRFGALWSLTTVNDSDSRGYGKSVLLQYLAYFLNRDFGGEAFTRVGMDASDAEENPVCALLASFDYAPTKNLNSLFFSAVEYCADFRLNDDRSLYERLYARLCERAGTADPVALIERCRDAYRAIKGRTLGPPDDTFLAVLCGGQTQPVQDYLDQVTPQKRSRSGANYLATLLLLIRAAGIGKVMLFCDQLEDFASPQTPKKTRSVEVEKFRDFVVELLPMADMISVVVTMHPRALASIEEFWQLADLPSLSHSVPTNRHVVVVMPPLRTLEQATRLLTAYITDARQDPAVVTDALAPFTEDAVKQLWAHSTRKPRDLLRKAHKMIMFAAEENLEVIDANAVTTHLARLTDADDVVVAGPSPVVSVAAPDFSRD